MHKTVTNVQGRVRTGCVSTGVPRRKEFRRPNALVPFPATQSRASCMMRPVEIGSSKDAESPTADSAAHGIGETANCCLRLQARLILRTYGYIIPPSTGASFPGYHLKRGTAPLRIASIRPFTEPFQNVSNHFKIANPMVQTHACYS